jgi:hypothetical protein
MVRNTDDRSDCPSYLCSGSPWSRVCREAFAYLPSSTVVLGDDRGEAARRRRAPCFVRMVLLAAAPLPTYASDSTLGAGRMRRARLESFRQFLA